MLIFLWFYILLTNGADNMPIPWNDLTGGGIFLNIQTPTSICKLYVSNGGTYMVPTSSSPPIYCDPRCVHTVRAERCTTPRPQILPHSNQTASSKVGVDWWAPVSNLSQMSIFETPMVDCVWEQRHYLPIINNESLNSQIVEIGRRHQLKFVKTCGRGNGSSWVWWCPGYATHWIEFGPYQNWKNSVVPPPNDDHCIFIDVMTGDWNAGNCTDSDEVLSSGARTRLCVTSPSHQGTLMVRTSDSRTVTISSKYNPGPPTAHPGTVDPSANAFDHGDKNFTDAVPVLHAVAIVFNFIGTATSSFPVTFSTVLAVSALFDDMRKCSSRYDASQIESDEVFGNPTRQSIGSTEDRYRYGALLFNNLLCWVWLLMIIFAVRILASYVTSQQQQGQEGRLASWCTATFGREMDCLPGIGLAMFFVLNVYQIRFAIVAINGEDQWMRFLGVIVLILHAVLALHTGAVVTRTTISIGLTRRFIAFQGYRKGREWFGALDLALQCVLAFGSNNLVSRSSSVCLSQFVLLGCVVFSHLVLVTFLSPMTLLWENGIVFLIDLGFVASVAITLLTHWESIVDVILCLLLLTATIGIGLRLVQALHEALCQKAQKPGNRNGGSHRSFTSDLESELLDRRAVHDLYSLMNRRLSTSEEERERDNGSTSGSGSLHVTLPAQREQMVQQALRRRAETARSVLTPVVIIRADSEPRSDVAEL